MTRLNDLREVHDELSASNFDFNLLPATSKYRKYHEWRSDPTKREIPDANTRARGKDALVGLKPFGLPGAIENQFEVRMSGFSFNEANGNSTLFGNIATLYGLTDTGLEDYIARAGFVPAKVIAGRLGTPTTETSEITGKKYKKRVTDSYTIPFGKVSDADTEFERQEAILTQLNTNFSITFKPEYLKRRR